MPPIPLLLSAGEASGDMYAARLAIALKQRLDVALFGMGGPQMRAAGVEIITDYAEVSVVGITEVLKRLPSLFRAMSRLVDEAERRRPPLAILTDFPGFHLRLARKLLPKGIRNVYFVCPQFWAWRPWRANPVRRRFALALCIFPFEEKFYADAGVPVKWQVKFMEQDTYNAVAAADLAIVSSGTATVETALLGKPMIVVYRLSPLTAKLAKPLVRSKYFSMVNLIAGRAVVPELIQDDFTPRRLAEEAAKLLSPSEEGKRRDEEICRGLAEVRELLGPPGAVDRAADAIAAYLQAGASNAN